MNAIIEVHDLTIKYENEIAIEDINLTIPQGVRGAIIGPNGAGKSTLMKGMLGLLPIHRGHVNYHNGTLLKDNLNKIAYVPQSSEVNWNFPTTVEEVVGMGIRSSLKLFHRRTDEERNRIEEAIELMNLESVRHRQIDQLSGGQKQRVFIARAIAQDADIYLLDEPLAGVDIYSEGIIMAQLQRFQDEGKTSLTVHHNLNTVEKYFDYIIMINKRLIDSGDIQDTFHEVNFERTYQTQSEITTSQPQRNLRLHNEKGEVHA